MNIETEICGKIKTVFQGVLPGLKVVGNWMIDDYCFRNVDVGHVDKMEIVVSPRKYDGYTSRIAEFTCSLETTFTVASDADLSRSIELYDLIIGQIDLWHGDIGAVKRDLGFEAFEPVGFRLDDGSFELDLDKKTRHIYSQFTVKGRIRG